VREKGGSFAKNLDLAKAQMLCLEDGSDLGEVHEALHGRRLRPQDYTTLITELRHARKWRLAVSVGDWLIEQPAKAGAEALPNLVHYNAMMRACAAAGQHEAAVQLLSAMAERGVAADSRSLATAISACERQGGCAREAIALLQPLVRAVEAEAEAEAEAVAVDTAFLSLAAASGPLPALVPPSLGDKGVLIACTSAMNACQKGGEWRAALQIFSWARARRLQPDSFCYGIALNACRSGGAAQEAVELLQAVLKGSGGQAVRVDGQMFVSAMWACLRVDEWERALELFEVRKAQRSLPPDTHSYAAAIAACAKGAASGQGLDASEFSARAVALLDEMQASAALRGNPHAFASAMAACNAAGEPSAALRLFGRLATGDAGCAVTESCLAAALAACGEDHVHAASLFARHPLRTPRAFNAMLGALSRGQQWVTLLALFDRMQAEGLPADQKALTLAILAADQVDERRAAALTQTLSELRGVSRAGATERAEMAGLLAARKGAAREQSKKGQAERKSAARGKRLLKAKAVKLPPPADFAPAEAAPPAAPPVEAVPAASAAAAAEDTQSAKTAVDKSLKDFLGADRRADFLTRKK